MSNFKTNCYHKYNIKRIDGKSIYQYIGVTEIIEVELTIEDTLPHVITCTHIGAHGRMRFTYQDTIFQMYYNAEYAVAIDNSRAINMSNITVATDFSKAFQVYSDAMSTGCDKNMIEIPYPECYKDEYK